MKEQSTSVSSRSKDIHNRSGYVDNVFAPGAAKVSSKVLDLVCLLLLLLLLLFAVHTVRLASEAVRSKFCCCCYDVRCNEAIGMSFICLLAAAVVVVVIDHHSMLLVCVGMLHHKLEREKRGRENSRDVCVCVER